MCGGGYAPPTAARLFLGSALGPGVALRFCWAEGRTKGRAQKWNVRLRRGIATASHQAAKP